MSSGLSSSGDAALRHTTRYLRAILGPAAASTTSTSMTSSAVGSSPRLASLSASRAAATTTTTTMTTTSSASSATSDSDGDAATTDANAGPNATHDDDARNQDAPGKAASQLDTETRVQRVIEILEDRTIAEEDKPEQLKDVLTQVAAGTELNVADLDNTVLSLLHRYKEDLAPTGQTFSPPNQAARQSGTMSRSSSFRRNLTPTSASSLAVKRAPGISTPTRPISPSPLRSQSPSIHVSRRDGDLSQSDTHAFLNHYSSTSSTATSSAPSSPFGSPRFLNATASEFRPNATAAEFRPTGASAVSNLRLPKTSGPNLSVKLPEAFKHPRSPIGTPLSESSPTLWSFQNSPLGTPKFATGGVAVSPSVHSAAANSYFPANGGGSGRMTPSASSSSLYTAPSIPSDPWHTYSEASTTPATLNPGISHSASTASSESSYDDAQHFDPFASTSSTTATQGLAQQTSTGKQQILSSESADEEDEWGIPATSYDEATRRENNAVSNWDLYADEEDEDGLEMLQYRGGQLLPDRDELALVEPPNKERPVFEEGYQPQSTAQYSQLPGSFSGPLDATPQAYPPEAGLGNASTNYVMTPFDVLCSIFAGSDVTPADLEEALARTGYDVDRSMEWIINNPRLPGVPRGAEEQVDHLHMLSLDDTHLMPGSGANSPALRRSPVPSSSGSRPLIVSRDSFQRSYSGNGRPASPRWPFDNSRPGTPGGRHERPGEGFFSGASGGAPSTRLCKYYLQGNCLRSDCRFSHDLGKAVCKFWLRGHCLKGEGRCEFLHSVPPHLANDVAVLRANALRVREQEKTRLMRYDEDMARQEGGRVEEDFPSLAAATASAAARHGAHQKDNPASRWAGIVKTGRPVPVNQRPTLPRSASNLSARAEERAAPFSQPRQSARIPLRPPTLLPTITTGASVSKLYEQYRENFFEYGNARNKCLVKAADCWKAGDGAGAKRWSKEAQDWNRQIAAEGATAAQSIIEERKRELREAVMSSGGRPGRADEIADRQYRGLECGAGLGVCLGVAAAGDGLGPEGSRLSSSERTEVAIDLHGLHADEALEILERFVLAIASEHTLRGLVYVIVGQERHTGTADAARGTRKVRLADAVGQWLDRYSYAFWLTNGIYAIDPYV